MWLICSFFWELFLAHSLHCHLLIKSFFFSFFFQPVSLECFVVSIICKNQRTSKRLPSLEKQLINEIIVIPQINHQATLCCVSNTVFQQVFIGDVNMILSGWQLRMSFHLGSNFSYCCLHFLLKCFFEDSSAIFSYHHFFGGAEWILWCNISWMVLWRFSSKVLFGHWPFVYLFFWIV